MEYPRGGGWPPGTAWINKCCDQHAASNQKTIILGKLRRKNTVTPRIKPACTRAAEITSLTNVGSSRPWPMVTSSVNCPSSNHLFRTMRMSRRMAVVAGGSCHPLIASSSRCLIALSGCCVASCRAIVSSSRHPLTVPPSRHLVPAGCCVAFPPRAALSSSHCTQASCCMAPSNAAAAIDHCPPHRHHCMPSSLSTSSTSATATATCIVERFTLMHWQKTRQQHHHH